ncbi:MAG: DUF4338 domain-containing protein [Smithella sp.]|nr:DUF4338 domain-containing protein [Smithella sp.]
MDDTIRVFSGRAISPKDIETIKWARKRFPQLSRSELAATLCEILEWTTPAGRGKVPQCLEMLAQLESEGIVQLPKLQTKKRPNKQPEQFCKSNIPGEDIIGDTRNYEPIILDIARAGEELKRWRAYVNKYHMLGDKQVFGSRLHYFIKSGDNELGCMQFSASAWALADRERWIGWSVEDRKKRLHLIVNNSRYLIFPWVKIKNLASKALAIAGRQIQEDWLREYCYAPVLLETFVDLEHFKGTCYKAANWIYLGESQGRGRMDRENEYALSRKAIFMYPLQKDFKECLRGEKPYKVVNPDEQ